MYRKARRYISTGGKNHVEGASTKGWEVSRARMCTSIACVQNTRVLRTMGGYGAESGVEWRVGEWYSVGAGEIRCNFPRPALDCLGMQSHPAHRHPSSCYLFLFPLQHLQLQHHRSGRHSLFTPDSSFTLSAAPCTALYLPLHPDLCACLNIISTVRSLNIHGP